MTLDKRSTRMSHANRCDPSSNPLTEQLTHRPFQQGRLRRSIIVQHVEAGLGQRMRAAESAALHAAIDVMLQRSVIALVDGQRGRLREAAQTEPELISVTL